MCCRVRETSNRSRVVAPGVLQCVWCSVQQCVLQCERTLEKLETALHQAVCLKALEILFQNTLPHTHCSTHTTTHTLKPGGARDCVASGLLQCVCCSVCAIVCVLQYDLKYVCCSVCAAECVLQHGYCNAVCACRSVLQHVCARKWPKGQRSIAVCVCTRAVKGRHVLVRMCCHVSIFACFCVYIRRSLLQRALPTNSHLELK